MAFCVITEKQSAIKKIAINKLPFDKKLTRKFLFNQNTNHLYLVVLFLVVLLSYTSLYNESLVYAIHNWFVCCSFSVCAQQMTFLQIYIFLYMFIDKAERYDFWPWPWLFFSPFLFHLKKEGRRMHIKNRAQKACLSARSCLFQINRSGLAKSIEQTNIVFLRSLTWNP